MDYAVCSVPAAPVRKKASHKAEMINQLLFGESMLILKKKNNWLKIQTLHDNYQGWIRNNLITPLDQVSPKTSAVTGALFNKLTIANKNMYVPAGSTLPDFGDDKGKIGELSYEFDGIHLNRTEIRPVEDVISVLVMPWLNAPYLWGGRTPLGVDCSGFVQVVFKMMGIDLLRDAWMQAGQGIKIKKLKDTRCGDLAFFKNKRGKITHVGILLNPSQIIHASGKVRIDSIDERGIINLDSGKRTHSLVSLRRYW